MKVTRDRFYEIKSNLRTPTQVKILTGSMDPFIKAGEKVLIRPFDPNSLKKLDTIIFWQEHKLICHFFYKKELKQNKWIYYAKALNSKKLDSPLTEDDILGVVIKPSLPQWKKFLMKFLF